MIFGTAVFKGFSLVFLDLVSFALGDLSVTGPNEIFSFFYEFFVVIEDTLPLNETRG